MGVLGYDHDPNKLIDGDVRLLNVFLLTINVCIIHIKVLSLYKELKQYDNENKKTIFTI